MALFLVQRLRILVLLRITNKGGAFATRSRPHKPDLITSERACRGSRASSLLPRLQNSTARGFDGVARPA
jgi:hypothetical protein